MNAALLVSLMGLAMSSDALKDLGASKHVRHQIMTLHVYVGYAFICTVATVQMKA